MSVVSFDQMPGNSRLWIYPCERQLTEEEQAVLHQEMTSFIGQWAAHKRDLSAAWQFRYNQFVLVSVDESRMTASGCSIDSLTHKLRDLGEKLRVNIIGNTGKIFFRQGEKIRCVERAEFRQLLTDGQIDLQTVVFNNIVPSLAELGRWEVPMSESWHEKAFALQTA